VLSRSCVELSINIMILEHHKPGNYKNEKMFQ